MRTLSLLTILLALVLCSGCLSGPEPLTDGTAQELDDAVDACWTTYWDERKVCDKAYADDAAWEPAKDTERTRQVKELWLTYLRGVQRRCWNRALDKLHDCLVEVEGSDAPDPVDVIDAPLATP